MLTAMRKGAKGVLSKLLIGFLVLSFGIWGVGDLVRSSGNNVVATVGSETVSVSEYEEAIQRLRQMLGEHLTPEILKSLNIFEITLNDLISRKLIALETDRLGIRVDEKELISTVANEQSFKNAQGYFDKTLFEQNLRESGLSEEGYLNRLSEQLSHTLLSNTLSGDSLFDKTAADYLYRAQNEQREIALVTIKPAATPSAAPSSDEIQAFYDRNKARYMAPEYRTITYIRLVPEEIFKDISISRQELFDVYKERIGSLSTPEKRDVTQLLYANKSEAENAFGLLRSGKTFEEAAASVEPLNKDNLALGMLTREQLPAGGAEVFGLAVNEYSFPVESPFGWHIFKVTNIQEKKTTPFEEISATLEKELRQQKAEGMVSSLTEKLEDAIAAGQSLSEAAESTGLHAITADPASLDGRRGDNTMVFDPQKDEALLNTAFALGEGETSELISEAGGGYIVAHVDRLTPSRQRTLEEVHGQVVSDLNAENALKQTLKEAKEAVTSINEKGMSAAEGLISKYDVKPVTLRRSGAQENADKASAALLTTDLIEQAFSLSSAKPATAPYIKDDVAVFAVLKHIEPAAAPAASAESKRLYETLYSAQKQNIRNELMQQYLDALKKRYPVSINQDVMQRFVDQF